MDVTFLFPSSVRIARDTLSFQHPIDSYRLSKKSNELYANEFVKKDIKSLYFCRKLFYVQTTNLIQKKADIPYLKGKERQISLEYLLPS